MAYEMILLDVKDQVATITLNRPDRMNAWNAEMAGELSDALEACNADDGVRAIVLTGAGRAFCAGADLGGRGDTFGGRERGGARQRTRRNVMPWEIDKPVIAALNGHAVGVGLTYPMLCDIRFVAEDAKLQFAFVRRGILPELASHVIVARVAGFSNAADVLLSGRMLNGKEAAELGLATRALPAEEVLPAAQERARDIARNAAPVSVAISKRLLWEGITSSVPDMLAREGELFAWLGNQPDAREGVASFLEKRPPEWKLSVSRDLPDALRREKD
ncbi:MAG: enoyl-CoA hydratase/isomerase family protein [Deltaproteobacteria bacterium]|nr:enoyl-CoA hydratase/isomerase family protein [Deltaproteobacteria bacterium]MBW2414017.1 enoyl-CoA hydratase/isomerase family protein [Deltaproteobacteria bacterium]